MQFDSQLTPAQLEALYEWAEVGGAYPADILLVREGENTVAGQGDARVRISPAGDTVDHPEPFEGDERELTPLTVPEDLTLNNTDQDTLILAAEAILAELAGRIEEDDPDGGTFHEAKDAWDQWRHEATTLARALGKSPDPVEPIGDRIAREGAAMLAAARDVDYDPAAEDEDGVPIFSDETRAAAQSDPRGERDR